MTEDEGRNLNHFATINKDLTVMLSKELELLSLDYL